MEIQELLNILTNVTIELTGIKMEKVRGDLKETEAKKKCVYALRKANAADSLQSAINEWMELK